MLTKAVNKEKLREIVLARSSDLGRAKVTALKPSKKGGIADLPLLGKQNTSRSHKTMVIFISLQEDYIVVTTSNTEEMDIEITAYSNIS